MEVSESVTEDVVIQIHDLPPSTEQKLDFFFILDCQSHLSMWKIKDLLPIKRQSLFLF